MSQMEAEFRIPKDRFADALAAIQALAGKETIHDRSGLHFSWVATEDFVRARTLEEALRAWRWNPDLDADGNIDGIWFEGEKSGDDTLLFEAIAPFVAPGSYIQMIGEDDSIWRWRFDGRHAHEEPARLVFGDAPGDPEAR